jgi:hypothetical protein
MVAAGEYNGVKQSIFLKSMDHIKQLSYLLALVFFGASTNSFSTPLVTCHPIHHPAKQRNLQKAMPIKENREKEGVTKRKTRPMMPPNGFADETEDPLNVQQCQN